MLVFRVYLFSMVGGYIQDLNVALFHTTIPLVIRSIARSEVGFDLNNMLMWDFIGLTYSFHANE